MFQKISQKIEDITFTGSYSISGYLRNLRGRLLSSEKFSEVFTLWVFTLKPFPGEGGPEQKNAKHRIFTQSEDSICIMGSSLSLFSLDSTVCLFAAAIPLHAFPNLNKLKTTPTPHENGSYGIKWGGPYAMFWGSVCHVLGT